jgi:hypothetical protein
MITKRNLAGAWLRETWAKARRQLLLYKRIVRIIELATDPLSVTSRVADVVPGRFRMYDHTVFVTLSISFMTMLVVVARFGVHMENCGADRGDHTHRSTC